MSDFSYINTEIEKTFFSDTPVSLFLSIQPILTFKNNITVNLTDKQKYQKYMLNYIETKLNETEFEIVKNKNIKMNFKRKDENSNIFISSDRYLEIIKSKFIKYVIQNCNKHFDTLVQNEPSLLNCRVEYLVSKPLLGF